MKGIRLGSRPEGMNRTCLLMLLDQAFLLGSHEKNLSPDAPRQGILLGSNEQNLSPDAPRQGILLGNGEIYLLYLKARWS